MELIGAEDLAIGPPGRVLAREISLSLAAGEILAVLGPNGAGKTTLFRTLLGLIAAHAGRVRLAGADAAHLTRAQIARRVALVPQALTAPFPYSGLDFVLMGRTAHLPALSAPGKVDVAAANAALERLGIAHMAQASVTRMSGGERQLVLIARALAQDAPAVVLDEPAAALDFGNRERLSQLLIQLATEGRGLILSTHDPAHAARIATRVLTIDRQGATAVGVAAEMLVPERLAALYTLTEAEVRRGLGWS